MFTVTLILLEKSGAQRKMEEIGSMALRKLDAEAQAPVGFRVAPNPGDNNN